MLVGCFFLWFDEISVFEAGKSLTDNVKQRIECWLRVDIFCGGGLLEVKYKKEEENVDSVSRNGESEGVLSGSHYGKRMSVGRWAYL